MHPHVSGGVVPELDELHGGEIKPLFSRYYRWIPPPRTRAAQQEYESNTVLYVPYVLDGPSLRLVRGGLWYLRTQLI
jgi:hypothetical protein